MDKDDLHENATVAPPVTTPAAVARRDRDEDLRAIGHAFLTILRDPAVSWQKSPAWPFIERVADSAGDHLAAASAEPSEHYDEVKATLQGAHRIMESISAIERRVGPVGSHARGYTHKITAALRHLDTLAALAAQPAASAEPLLFAINSVLKSFKESEKAGYHTSDREFAIGLLEYGLEKYHSAPVAAHKPNGGMSPRIMRVVKK